MFWGTVFLVVLIRKQIVKAAIYCRDFIKMKASVDKEL